MSEEQAPPVEAQETTVVPPSLDWSRPDWFLQRLVNITNVEPNIAIGMTLLVGGFLVSGQMVHRTKYFDGIGEAIATTVKATGADEALVESVRAGYAKYGDFGNSDPNEFLDITFIHLKDARFFNTSGNPIPRNGGVWWRCRLTEVSGFMLGSLSAS